MFCLLLTVLPQTDSSRMEKTNFASRLECRLQCFKCIVGGIVAIVHLIETSKIACIWCGDTMRRMQTGTSNEQSCFPLALQRSFSYLPQTLSQVVLFQYSSAIFSISLFLVFFSFFLLPVSSFYTTSLSLLGYGSSAMLFLTSSSNNTCLSLISRSIFGSLFIIVCLTSSKFSVWRSSLGQAWESNMKAWHRDSPTVLR